MKSTRIKGDIVKTLADNRESLVLYTMLRKVPTIGFSVAAVFISVLFGISFAYAASEIKYETAFNGVSDKAIVELLTAVSNTAQKQDSPVVTVNLLKYRVKQDIPNLVKALRSRGYYGSEIDFEIIDTGSSTVKVAFNISLGPVFILKTFELVLKGGGNLVLPSLKDLDIGINEPFIPKDVVTAKEDIVSHLKKTGYAFGKISDTKAVANMELHTVDVTLEVDSGPLCRFGKVVFNGLVSIKESYMRSKCPWKEGDVYSSDLLQTARVNISETGLVAYARVEHGEKLDEKGLLPINVELKERKHRTIQGGLAYDTEDGIAAAFGWQHRNLFHGAELLKLRLVVSGTTYSIDATYKDPGFLRQDQMLLLQYGSAKENTRAYESIYLESLAGIERKLSDTMILQAALSYKLSEVEQKEEDETHGLFKMPLVFKWDTRDSSMDPQKGWRLTARLTPYYDTLSSNSVFSKAYLSYSHYLKLMDSPALVLAARGALGSIHGSDRDSVPADERFYAGGSGSVRGYAYQKVGPMDGDNPTGGGGLFEATMELRYKITKLIGVVGFVDAGSAFEGQGPDFDEKIRIGVGPGIRYYSPIGPVRLDVGIPLTRRNDIDDSYQIYVSLGQAF